MFLRLLLLLLAVLPGVARAGALRVVATVPDLAAIAEEVGGEHVRVTSLSLPTQDPHFVDAKPSLALELSRADALLMVGLGLEAGWLPTLQTGARNRAIQSGGTGTFDASAYVRLLGVPAGQVDRSMGDIHPGGNPHYLFDPRAAIQVAAGLAQHLGHIDPTHAVAYAENAADFERRIRERLPAWQERLAPLKDEPVVAFHASFPYLEDWVGFRIVDHLEPKPGVPPNPQHVAHVLADMRQTGARIVLQEEYFPMTTSKLVASQVDGVAVAVPGGADVREGETYIENIDQLVERLATAAEQVR